MKKASKSPQICLTNFSCCSEFIFLEQPLIALLPKYFDEIKKKLESETDIINLYIPIEIGFIKLYMIEK